MIKILAIVQKCSDLMIYVRIFRIVKNVMINTNVRLWIYHTPLSARSLTMCEYCMKDKQII